MELPRGKKFTMMAAASSWHAVNVVGCAARFFVSRATLKDPPPCFTILKGLMRPRRSALSPFYLFFLIVLINANSVFCTAISRKQTRLVTHRGARLKPKGQTASVINRAIQNCETAWSILSTQQVDVDREFAVDAQKCFCTLNFMMISNSPFKLQANGYLHKDKQTR